MLLRHWEARCQVPETTTLTTWLNTQSRSFSQGRDMFLICMIYDQYVPPVLQRPQKNVISPIFCTNLRLEAPLPVYFSCTTFRRSATTSDTLLISKCTTRRWTLRCSNYSCSVAKRQQFPCALRTATSSLKFENVVPEGWICFFPVL